MFKKDSLLFFWRMHFYAVSNIVEGPLRKNGTIGFCEVIHTLSWYQTLVMNALAMSDAPKSLHYFPLCYSIEHRGARQGGFTKHHCALFSCETDEQNSCF